MNLLQELRDQVSALTEQLDSRERDLDEALEKIDLLETQLSKAKGALDDIRYSATQALNE